MANRSGPRITSLVSLYISVLFTVLCAVVPNYWTLLISRVMIGIGVGMNMSSSGLLFTNGASCKKVYLQGTFVWVIAMDIAAVWVGVLGYFVLDYLSWREFVLLTSIPLFVPPILLLHFSVTEDITGNSEAVEESRGILESNVVSNVVSSGVSNIEDNVENNAAACPNDSCNFPTLRVFKLSICTFLNAFSLYGLIIVFPKLLQSVNRRQGMDEEDPCATVVRGTNFLQLALINGGCLAGAMLGGWLHDRFPFKVVYPTLAAVATAGFVLLFVRQDGYWMVVLIGFVMNVMLYVEDIEICFIQYDISFFGRENMNVASSVVLAAELFGSALGCTCASFLSPGLEVFIAIGVMLTISLIFLK